MKKYLMASFATLAGLIIFSAQALAQWQVPNHSVPIGRGAGVTGFNSAAPGAAGGALTSNGTGSDPTFQPASPAGAPLSLCTGLTDQTAYVQAVLNIGSAFIPVGITCLATHVIIPTNGIFQVAANASLKKFGSSNVVLVVAGGANVTLLGPGSIDMNSDPLGNVTFAANTGTIVDGVHFKNGTLHDIYFQDVSGWTVKNSFFTNNAYFANIINYAIGADEADINILNNYCDRTGVPNPAPGGAGQCFYFVPQSHNISRVRVSNNNCIGPGAAQISPDESSCLVMLSEGMGTFWQFPEAGVTGNITKDFNFPYSLGGIQNGLVANNTAIGAGPQGYCYEIGGNKDSIWSNNSCDGLFTTGSPFILNNSTGVSVVGGTIMHRATGAGAQAFAAISSGSGTGKNNTIQGMTFDLSGGVGIYVTSDNINIGGNFFNGNGTAVNAINLNSIGGNRTVNGNNAVGFTGPALVNPTATDIFCGNNFLGCRIAGQTSGVVSVDVQAVAGTYNFNLPTGAGTSGQPLLSGGGGAAPMTFERLPLSGLVQGATNTVLANPTNATANFAAFSMPSCSTAASALNWTTNTGFICNSAIASTTVATTSVTTNASFFPLFVASSSNGNQAVDLGAGLTFNPSSNILSTTGVILSAVVPVTLSGAGVSLVRSIGNGGGYFYDVGTGDTAASSIAFRNKSTFETGFTMTFGGRFDSVGGYSSNGTNGLSATTTIRDAAGTGTCSLIFTGGLKTGGTC